MLPASEAAALCSGIPITTLYLALRALSALLGPVAPCNQIGMHPCAHCTACSYNCDTYGLTTLHNIKVGCVGRAVPWQLACLRRLHAPAAAAPARSAPVQSRLADLSLCTPAAGPLLARDLHLL